MRVELLWRDVRYAVRSFRRAPLAALTIVATVALGLGMVTVAFTIYSTLFLRVDAVQDPDELFAVQRQTRPGAKSWLPFTRREYEALRRESGAFHEVAAMVSGVDTRLDGHPASGTLVSGNFFALLGVHPALGRALTNADDDPAAPASVLVLSHRGWQKLFDGDRSAVGGTRLINGSRYLVVGIMPEDFRGLAVQPPDYWAPLALAGQFRRSYLEKGDDIPLDVVGRLKPGMHPQATTAALGVWMAQTPVLRKLPGDGASIALVPSRGLLSSEAVEALTVFSPVFVAFSLILMIGCANVANLLLARGVSRQREFGTRIAVGAARGQIVRQLLTESLLLSLASAACGLAFSRLLLAVAVRLTISATPPELAERLPLLSPTLDWRVVVFAIGAAAVATLLFGLAPALQAAKADVLSSTRGETVLGARPLRLRHALIGAQVGASALLLICAAVFLRSAFAAANVDPGVRTADTVVVPIGNETLRAAMIQEVISQPPVALAAASSPEMFGRFRSATVEVTSTAAGAGNTRSRPVEYQLVSPQYFEVLGIPVSRGRTFSPLERGLEARVAVLSERTARLLWPDGDAVGQTLRFDADPRPAPTHAAASAPTPTGTFTVVGVVRDVGNGAGLFGLNGPQVYVPTALESANSSLTVRVNGDPDAARRVLTERLVGIDAGLGDIWTMRSRAGMRGYVLGIGFAVTITLGILALALTLSGLYSVLSYVVAQRTKEIGVRLALGGSAARIAILVLSQLLRPVLTGMVCGAGLAAAVAAVIVAAGPAGPGETVQVFDVAAYAVSVIVILAGCLLAACVPVVRALRVSPMATLKAE